MIEPAAKLRCFFHERNRGILRAYVAGDLDMVSPSSSARMLVAATREGESPEAKSALWRLILQTEEALEAQPSADADEVAELVGDLLAAYLLVDELRPSRFGSELPSRPRLARLLFDAALDQLRKGSADPGALAFNRAAAYFSAEAPAPPELLAADLAARILQEELGNIIGAALMPQDILRLRELEAARVSYDALEHERYLRSIYSIVDVFWGGSLFNAAGRLIASMLPYLEWRGRNGGNIDYITALHRFAKLALEDGDYATAYKAYRNFEEMLDPLDDPSLVALGRLGRGCALLGFGMYHGAATLLEESLRNLDDDDFRSEAMIALSRALLEAGNYEGAVRFHGEWCDLTGKDAPEFPCEVEARRSLAEGDKTVALDWLERSGESPTGARDEQWGLHRALLAARTKADLGRFEDAHVDLTIALSIARYFFKYPDRPALDALAAEISVAIGRPDHAEQFLRRALDEDQKRLVGRLGIGTANQRYAQLREMRQRVEQWLCLALATRAEGASARGYRALILTKALGPYVARRTIQAAAEAATEDEGVAKKVLDLGAARARLGALATSVLTGAPAAGEAFMETLAEKERLEFEVSLSTRELDLVDLVEHNDAPSVIMGVPADAVLIDYVRYSLGPGRSEEHYAAFVVVGRDPSGGDFVDLGDASEIDRNVRDFYDLIQSGSAGGAISRRFGRSPGEALRAKLIDRLRPVFNGRSHLFLSPDGLLARLPFECLPVGKFGFLIDEFTIGYVSSSRTAVYFHEQKPSQGSAPIVIGAPDYGAGAASPDVRFKPLEGTRQEAAEVASLLGVAPLMGKAASKCVLHGANPRILHVATHGYFLSDARSRSILSKAPLLRSGLALAGANSDDGSGSGILTAEEVLSLNLRDTELVVLSACETGIGEYERGEALAGLARSFEAAGAWSVVTSLWKVPDDATRDLMMALYRQLAAGVRRPDALRQAKLATRARHRAMLSWAGFIIQGYPGRITSPRALQDGTMQ